MTWKRKIAKEWLWLVCTPVGVALGWTIFCCFLPGITVVEFWEEFVFEGKGFNQERRVFVISIGLVYFIRLTVWSIKQLRKAQK